MILDTKIPQLTIVLQHPCPQLLHPGFLFVLEIALDEAFVELDDLSEAYLPMRRAVQPPRCLDHLQRLVVRRPERHALQPVVDEVHDLANGPLLVLVALFKVPHQFLRNLDRGAEFDDGSTPEAMCMKVGHADRDDLDSDVVVG